jgi:hypothetical protein
VLGFFPLDAGAGAEPRLRLGTGHVLEEGATVEYVWLTVLDRRSISAKTDWRFHYSTSDTTYA